MQAAPARYVSVSELYSTDEVELLLDEIRELEPTSCRGEDVQDFEIAGSGCSGGEGATGDGGRSPAGTEVSWDSHAVYRAACGPPAAPLAPVYLARTVRGALSALLAAAACAAAACAAAGGRAAARPLLLAALTAALTHATLAALHVTRLHRIMPLPWAGIGAAAALGALLGQVAGGSLLLHHVVSRRVPPPAHRLYAAAVGLAYASAALAAAYAWRALRAWRAPARGAYRAVPPAPPPAAPPPPAATHPL